MTVSYTDQLDGYVKKINTHNAKDLDGLQLAWRWIGDPSDTTLVEVYEVRLATNVCAAVPAKIKEMLRSYLPYFGLEDPDQMS